MAIVCDTSPLSYLVLIGEVEVLPELYGEVWVPPAVEEELRHPGGPPEVQEWIGSEPRWLKARDPSGNPFSELSREIADLAQDLDRGERDAIQLATGPEASLLVIDERDGRRIAKRLSVSLTGTIGVLDLAGDEGLTDVESAVDRLRETSFRASPELYRWLLERHR